MSVCCHKPFDEHSVDELQSVDAPLGSVGQRVVVTFLLAYKFALSPVLPSSCKFYPTCSAYAQEAVQRYGVRRGLILTAKRLLRCRPFAAGGIDLVPDGSLHDA